ncbi:ATP-binding protein [Myxosarcina sp. GI1]|uniref:ATP-binding protein n=1 Tax=Myxosarcina sp. GI1 TaxID=1541065 RepID=UPI00209FB2AB|nr:ATP-binding protein [Myxosarcina sp. GI1]
MSIPVLLVGVWITYDRARAAFSKTASQNLTESAERKGDSIEQSVESLRSNLASISDVAILKSESADYQPFIDRLSQVLPTNILCVQLHDLLLNRVTATTCDETMKVDASLWSRTQSQLLTTTEQIDVKLLLPSKSTIQEVSSVGEQPFQSQLKLWLTAPVYDRQGQLRYALSVKSAVLDRENIEPGSLNGYPVVIDQDGIILAHPLVQKVGRNIQQMPDVQKLNDLLEKATSDSAESRDLERLYYLEQDGVELIVGYSAIASPLTQDRQQKWMVLAVTPVNAALEPLKTIRRALVGMTVGLIIGSILFTVYVSRELARPLEQLRDYAFKKELLDSSDRLPEDFPIREFQQLSLALNEMVDRLRAWGAEIVSAWQEAKNADRLKSEFLATTSHELRTPLNGIINCVRIVKDECCDSKEEEREFLQQADAAALHLLEIINDILDLSKIEAGKLSVELERVSLRKIINEVVELHKVPIQKKALSFRTPVWNRELYVLADPAKLKQVLINIVSNAVKFTEFGSIEITVNVIESELVTSTQPKSLLLKANNYSSHDEEVGNFYSASSNERESSTETLATDANTEESDKTALLKTREQISNSLVAIVIKDTGIGIDIGKQERLFHPFVMVDGSTTRKFGGTGLGLAISRNLVELMNGKISLYSAGEFQGTTVTIILPLAEATSYQ